MHDLAQFAIGAGHRLGVRRAIAMPAGIRQLLGPEGHRPGRDVDPIECREGEVEELTWGEGGLIA